MNKNKLGNIFLLIGIIAYNFLFWQEKLGINLLLFSSLLGGFAFYLNPTSTKSKNAWITWFGTLISGIFVVIFNTGISKFTHISSFLIMLGFIHQTEMRSVLYSFLNSVSNIIKAPISLAYARKENEKPKSSWGRFWYYIRLSAIPVLVFFVFYLLFKGANPKFEALSAQILEKLEHFFSDFAQYISFTWLFFIGFGLIITAGIIYNREIEYFLKRDLSFTDFLKRVRGKKTINNPKGRTINRPSNFSLLALKNENRIAILLIAMVNLMLLVVNIIDINWVWIGFEIPDGFSLKQFVHEGTYLLIASIVLSLSIILYIFRKNQNFYPGRNILKPLSYVWLFQNVILAISVFLRNYHYIHYHGLAYKRLGVILFLALTVVGIIFMFLKIKEVRSGYYLVRKNSWALYTALVLMCCVNWDTLIARYNLEHWNYSQIDIDFYLQLPDRAMPEVLENLDMVKKQMDNHKSNSVRWVNNLDFERFVNHLSFRRERFIERHEKLGLPSWNHADANAYVYLKNWDETKFSEAIEVHSSANRNQIISQP